MGYFERREPPGLFAVRCGGVSAVALSFLMVMPGCWGDRPPGAPVVDGPDTGLPEDTLWFWARSTDPNGGNLSYFFDWGDGTGENWTAELASGDTFYRRHVYPDTGEYVVQVRCRDKTGLESEWSVPLEMMVGFAGPLTPDQPQAPAEVYEDTTYWFTTVAGHIHGDSVSIRFDWGDTLGDWTGFFPAGGTVSDSHTYQTTGEYLVRALARDKQDNLSPWSCAETVAVTRRPLEPPRSIIIRASAGISVRLRWDTGHNCDSVEYGLWFRPLDSNECYLLETVTGSTAFHDPGGVTGDYTISSRFEDVEVFAAETVSTIPVFTDVEVLYELNAGGLAGYGWDSLTCIGHLHSMEDTTFAPLVDFYFTDLTPGSTGPGYYVSSPHIGPDDPGGLVPAGPWRRTGLLNLWGNPQEALPEYDSLLYTDLADVSVLESYVAVYTAEGHYALLRTFGPNPDSATIPVVSWFQKIRGLRLIRHGDIGR